MPSTQDRISLLIKAKRRETGAGVRAAAKAARISAPTLSRLERGVAVTLPDVRTLERLAKWLGVSMGELLGEREGKREMKAPEISTPELVEVHLRADKNLTPATAKALAQMFKTLYEHASKPTK